LEGIRVKKTLKWIIEKNILGENKVDLSENILSTILEVSSYITT